MTILTWLRTALYMSGFILFWGWVALRVERFDERLGGALPGGTLWPGMALILTGGVLVLSCGFLFVRRGRGTPAPFDPPREFVVRGPYRCVRNPMYIGGLVLLMGFAFYRRSPSIIVLSGALAIALELLVVLFEERDLEHRFGASYRQYKAQVRRWLPRMPE